MMGGNAELQVVGSESIAREFGNDRSSHRKSSIEKDVLEIFTKFTGKHLCQSLFFNNKTLPQVFSCEFCEIFRNIFFTEHLRVTASGDRYYITRSY